MPQCYFAMLVALVVSSQALTGLFGLSFCTSVLSLFYQLLSIPNTQLVYDSLPVPVKSPVTPVFCF